MPDPICFIFNNVGSFRLQRYLIKYCRDNGREVVVIYNGSRNKIFLEAKSELEHLGVECFASEDYHNESVTVDANNSRRIAFLLKFIPKRIINRYWYQVRLYSYALGLMQDVSPSMLVVSEDGVSASHFLLSAAQRMGIPIVDVPYGNATHEEFDLDIRRKVFSGSNLAATGVAGWCLKLIAPQWVKKGSNAGQLMFPSDYILKQELIGVSIRDPWIVHGGSADRLCAESPIAMKQYIGEGIPQEKISLTGSPYSDRLLEGLVDDEVSASAFLKPNYINGDMPRILVSWPPSYHSTFIGSSEYDTFEEMTIDILKYIGSMKNCDVKVSLHPATDPGIVDLLAEHDIETTSEDIIKLMPKIDIFITYFSSSIRWALAAGKVVLNYDAYKIKLTHFDPAPGFWTTAENAELKAKLAELVTNEAEFARLAGAQAADAPNWGFLDGKCNERILAEIDQLMEKHIGGR